ncbi:MAG: IS30 family transposase [Enterococcus sp.]|nr:IS30 family transposase [Enterococcus sp.]
MRTNSYNRIDFRERTVIEKELKQHHTIQKSARGIADLIGKDHSSVIREVKSNRCIKGGKDKHKKPTPEYLEKSGCPFLFKWPYTCTGCHREFNCRTRYKVIYSAKLADDLSRATRHDSRSGVNMTQAEFSKKISIIKDGLERGLSPYAIAVNNQEELGLSVSTIYKWIDKGYGNLKPIDLRRKVKYKPRKEHQDPKPTKHGKDRSYKAFLDLPKDEQDSAWEMDTIIGKKNDRQCVLSLFDRASKFQFYLLMRAKTCSNVLEYFDLIENLLGAFSFNDLIHNILTDNGSEFNNFEALEKSIHKGNRTKIYYCDANQSQQKACCEKNHEEFRKIIPKRRGISFDDLDNKDMAYIMSHVNSNVRASLLGRSPIEIVKQTGSPIWERILEIFSIYEVPYPSLNLTPNMVNLERKERGLTPILD